MASPLYIVSNLCKQNFRATLGAAMLKKLKYISAI